jgi:glycine hydroxymethyltransferase
MSLLYNDLAIFNAIEKERERQHQTLELLASENFVSQDVLEAMGSVMTNKYAEVYQGRRNYSGCEYVDVAEQLAIERLTRLFDVNYANVQADSGAQANLAVFYALLRPGDKVLRMNLSDSGYLTHGSPTNILEKWFEIATYGVREDTHLLDYDHLEAVAKWEKPKLIVAGTSAYPRKLDFARFKEIANKVGAKLMVDMSHIAGLVAAGLHPSPIPYADVVTSTTHQTLRGPRGGIILTDHEEMFKAVNKAVFPGIQGGPLMHMIAAKAVAFNEAAQLSFKKYVRQMIENAETLVETLKQEGAVLVSGGTDTHVVLMDVRPWGLTGKAAEMLLEKVGITVNKNTIPYDPESLLVTSGVLIGTAALTTRGMKKDEMVQIAEIIAAVLKSKGNPKVLELAKETIKSICNSYPLFQHQQQQKLYVV